MYIQLYVRVLNKCTSNGIILLNEDEIEGVGVSYCIFAYLQFKNVTSEAKYQQITNNMQYQ